jgi:hypothetical protein
MAAAPSNEGVREIPDDVLHGGDADAADLRLRLGAWTRNMGELARRFAQAAPFEHVAIDDFFEAEFAASLVAAFPAPDEGMWHVYDNPLERKRACSNTAAMPAPLRNAIFALCAPAAVALVRQITGLPAASALQVARPPAPL